MTVKLSLVPGGVPPEQRSDQRNRNAVMVAHRPGRLPRKSVHHPHLTLAGKPVPPCGTGCTTTRPAGMVMRGAGWTVETVDLENVSGNAEQGESDFNGKVMADANGLWLLVRRPNRVFYVRTMGEAQGIVGDDWAALQVVSRWIFSGPVKEDGSWN